MSNKELKELMSIICEGQDSEQRRKVENFIEYRVQLIDSLDKEIERLNNIIKEVREYIEKSKSKLPLGINDFTCEMVYSDEVVLANELLKILDKVDKENNNGN